MGKQRRYILLIIISTFIFGACKKEVEPVLQAGKTVFTLKGFIDEQSLEAEAGKNSFYLFTSYDRDSNQNLRYKGNLKKTCIDCKESIEFIFHGGTSSSISDSILKPGKYPFYHQAIDTSISYRVVYRAHQTNQPISSFSWKFPDGSTSIDSTPVKVYTNPQTIQVVLLLKYNNNCQADVSLPVRINRAMSVNPIRFSYQFVQGTNRYVTFTPILSDTAVNGKFIWEFGDGSSTENYGLINHNYQDSGAYKVCVKTLYKGDTLSYCERIKTPDKKNCIASFSPNITVNTEIKRSNSIELRYTDANGNQFNSNDANQDLLSYFEVLGVQDYLKNEMNQSTKSLDIRFNCYLKGNTGIKKMQNFSGKIAVAIP